MERFPKNLPVIYFQNCHQRLADLDRRCVEKICSIASWLKLVGAGPEGQRPSPGIYGVELIENVSALSSRIDFPQSAFLPASVSERRITSTGKCGPPMRSVFVFANPSRTRPYTTLKEKPRACMSVSVHPPGLFAISPSASRRLSWGCDEVG